MSEDGRDGRDAVDGSCLCGAVRYRLHAIAGPLECCHCPRCRRASGSAFMAGLGVRRADFEWLSATDGVRSFEAPLRDAPPAWRHSFCATCGAPVPDPDADGEWFEVPAGGLQGPALADLAVDRHIYVEHAAPWHGFADGVARCTAEDIRRLRAAEADD